MPVLWKGLAQCQPEQSDMGWNFLLFLSFASMVIYYIPGSEIMEFPSVINFDIITNNDIDFQFHFLP